VAGAQTFSNDVLTKVTLAKMVFPETFTSISPTVVRMDGHDALCYELYIVNMSAAPAELSRVQVTDGTTVLSDESGAKLAADLRHTAKTQPVAGSEGLLAPGEQIVYYAFFNLPDGTAAPSAIHHVLTMRQQGGTDDLQVTTQPVAVKTAKVVIQSPLRGSNWVAANGPGNTSGHRRGIIPVDGAARVPQRFAIDWVEIDKSGKTYSGDDKKNGSYFAYGKKIHAVADGVVTEVKDGIPQNVPGIASRAVPITFDTVGGNHIILDLGGGVYAFYAHLQPGSLRVKVGDKVKAGEVIALLGNSGNSTEPHLHFHLIDRSSPLGGEGLPFAYPSYQLLGKGSLDEAVHVDWLAAPKTVRGEIPAEDEIVDFGPETQ
jgi:murein DD-endopeptidase MepM/ murein hydrolase activator NlpD